MSDREGLLWIGAIMACIVVGAVIFIRSLPPAATTRTITVTFSSDVEYPAFFVVSKNGTVKVFGEHGTGSVQDGH
jgi:hypothetical protein